MTHATRVLLDGLAFPEAPRWRRDRLWFTDQHAHTVAWVQPSGAAATVASLPDLPGGLGWLPDGTLLVVAMTQRRVYRRVADMWQVHADLAKLAAFHCNDMLVDTAGRAYVGNFGYDLHGGEPPRPTELVMVAPDGSARVVARDLTFPNGCVLSADGRQLIVAETFGHRLSQFDVAPDGRLRNHRIWADLGDATPDGICLDQNGGIWVASPTTDDLRYYDATGDEQRRLSVRGTPYACMLGGADRRTLFVLTAETDDPVEAARSQSGRIEVLDVAIPGAGWP